MVLERQEYTFTANSKGVYAPLAGDPSEEVRVMACTDDLLTASSGVAGRLLVSRALEGRSGGRNTEPADVSCSCRVFLCSASFSLKESLSGSNLTGFSATFGGATDRESEMEKGERGEGEKREREALYTCTSSHVHPSPLPGIWIRIWNKSQLSMFYFQLFTMHAHTIIYTSPQYTYTVLEPLQ